MLTVYYMTVFFIFGLPWGAWGILGIEQRSSENKTPHPYKWKIISWLFIICYPIAFIMLVTAVLMGFW